MGAIVPDLEDMISWATAPMRCSSEAATDEECRQVPWMSLEVNVRAAR
jgi:hypothetical protein